MYKSRWSNGQQKENKTKKLCDPQKVRSHNNNGHILIVFWAHGHLEVREKERERERKRGEAGREERERRERVDHLQQ